MNRQANPITDERRIVEPPSPTETPEYRMMRAAEETIRRAVRDAVLEATYASGPYHEQLGALEDALMGVLCRRDLGWALAYLAGVQMAPELLRQFADRAGQTRRPTPRAWRGAVDPPRKGGRSSGDSSVGGGGDFRRKRASDLSARHKMAKTQLQFVPAARLADKIATELADACERIAVAGSIRRGEPTVGDLELVVIPRRQADLFGVPGASLLEPRINALVAAGRLLRGRCDGQRYKQLLIPAVEGLALDLFIVEPEAWGVQLAIRTGPARYSQAIVTERSRGGLLDDGLAVAQGRLWRSDQVMTAMIDAADYRGPFCHTTGEPFDTPEEADFLAHAGGWIEPADRARALHSQHQHQGATP